MPEDRLIDLGYAELFDEPDRPLRTTVRHLRLIGVACVVLVCLVLIGGAAPPPPAPFTRLGLVRSEELLSVQSMPSLAGGLVLTSTQDGEVFAYHPDGRLAWQFQPAADPGRNAVFFDVYELDGAVAVVRMMLSSFNGSGAEISDTGTVGLDPATGRERWRVKGSPRRVGDLVVVTGGEAPGDVKGASVYRSLPDDLLWSVPAAPIIAVDTITDALMTVTDEGLFTEYVLSTGAVRTTGRVELPKVPEGEGQVGLRVFRDRVVVQAFKYTANSPTVEAQAYDRATLEPIAQAPVDLFVGLEECGPVLCGFTYRQTYVLDRDTHAVLWETAPGESLMWTTSGLVRGSGALRLVDPRTGRTLVEAGGWEQVYFRRQHYGEPMPAVMIRRSMDRTYLGHLTPQGIRVLGSVPRQLSECQSRQDLLVCTAGTGGVEVWRLNVRL